MPIPHIDDYREKKEKSYSSWYLLAGIVGVALFLFFLVSTKIIIFIVELAIAHWFYFSVGVLVLLILIKKIKKHKRMKEIKREDEYRY